MLTRLRQLDNDYKQILFVVGVVIAALYLAGIGLFAFTGKLALLAAAVVITTCLAFVAGLIWTAQHLFPTDRQG